MYPATSHKWDASHLIRRSIWKFNIPPGHPPPQAFELLKIGLFKFPPLGAKKPFKCPTISTELPLLKDKFRLQSNTLHAFQREICRNDTFNLLLKTLLKEIFTNRGEILSCKSIKLCKNRKKTQWRITSEITQEINPVQIPHPSNATFKFPLPGHDAQSNARGMPGGGGVEVSNWSSHNSSA